MIDYKLMNYRTRIITQLAEIRQSDWDQLLAQQNEATPFLRYEFLAALEQTNCACERSGWSTRFVTLWQMAADGAGEQLVAALPLYAKTHSYGEYVFDWAWADAYQRNDLPYYPKLLSAIPFTPVMGNRLLAVDAPARQALLATALALAKESKMSSLHVLYPPAAEAQQWVDAGMMLRTGVQFHWQNQGYTDFEQFLESLERKKRKNIRAERRKVAEAGVTFRRIRGQDATPEDWAFFTLCYNRTYREHCSTPYLNLPFFSRIGQTMPENLLLIVAERAGKQIASSLLVYQQDAQHSVLYGRYWGALEHIDCLHFETSYYQPLEFCIDEKIAVFEGGAQGEHKMARGFLPVVTYSAHWLAHPAFADAVANFLKRETGGMANYVSELEERNPFKISGASRPALLSITEPSNS